MEEFWDSEDRTELSSKKKLAKFIIYLISRKRIAQCSLMYSTNFSCKEEINIGTIFCMIFLFLCEYTRLEILSNDQELRQYDEEQVLKSHVAVLFWVTVMSNASVPGIEIVHGSLPTLKPAAL